MLTLYKHSKTDALNMSLGDFLGDFLYNTVLQSPREEIIELIRKRKVAKTGSYFNIFLIGLKGKYNREIVERALSSSDGRWNSKKFELCKCYTLTSLVY